MKKTLLALAIFAILFLPNVGISGKRPVDPEHCARAQKLLVPGDLIFLAIDNPIFFRVAEINDTWVSHVGIAFKKEDSWVVAESTYPESKETPLCDFINKGYEQKLAIRRLTGHELSSSEVESLYKISVASYGLPYDTGFDYDNDKKSFCSKFAEKNFLAALGIEIGKRQTFKELFEGATNAEQKVKFWKLWFGGSIPWNRVTVTPYQIYIDQNLETIFDNSKQI